MTKNLPSRVRILQTSSPAHVLPVFELYIHVIIPFCRWPQHLNVLSIRLAMLVCAKERCLKEGVGDWQLCSLETKEEDA